MKDVHRRRGRRSGFAVALVLWAGILAAFGSASMAEDETVVVTKKSGGRVEGVIVSKTDTHIEVRTRFGPQRIHRADILRVERGQGAGTSFEARRGEVADTDGRALIDLGVWAHKHKLWREARTAYEEAMEVAGPHYKEAVMRLGALAMDTKDYRLAVLSFHTLADRFKDDRAWRAMQKAEGILRDDRQTFWTRARKEHEAGHWEAAILAYRNALYRTVFDKAQLPGDVGRAEVEKALLRCRLEYDAAMREAWAVRPDMEAAAMPERTRQAWEEVQTTFARAAESDLLAPALERVRKQVAALGPILPYVFPVEYGEGEAIRKAMTDLLFRERMPPAPMVEAWRAGDGLARREFFHGYAIELAGRLNSPLTALDRGTAAWRLLERPANLRKETRRVTLHELRIDPERFAGRWVALVGTCAGPGPEEPRGRTLRLAAAPHPDLGVIAYGEAMRPVHAFLRDIRKGRDDRYLDELATRYPYGEAEEVMITAGPGAEAVCYGRLLARAEQVPFHVFEVWAMDAVQDPEALLLAERLKPTLRCAFDETPLASVLDFVRMVTEAEVVFAGGEVPEIGITLDVQGAPAAEVVEKIAGACGLDWTRRGKAVLMKKTLTDVEAARKRQVLALALGETAGGNARTR